MSNSGLITKHETVEKGHFSPQVAQAHYESREQHYPP